mmetsp:Transcript_41442/g.128853  ORF Transcript_41442/g.128853 Transcript_41442/m.128853 type:complete len:390 (+) Transcript_41442:71-1240(+)
MGATCMQVNLASELSRVGIVWRRMRALDKRYRLTTLMSSSWDIRYPPWNHHCWWSIRGGGGRDGGTRRRGAAGSAGRHVRSRTSGNSLHGTTDRRRRHVRRRARLPQCRPGRGGRLGGCPARRVRARPSNKWHLPHELQPRRGGAAGATGRGRRPDHDAPTLHRGEAAAAVRAPRRGQEATAALHLLHLDCQLLLDLRVSLLNRKLVPHELVLRLLLLPLEGEGGGLLLQLSPLLLRRLLQQHELLVVVLAEEHLLLLGLLVQHQAVLMLLLVGVRVQPVHLLFVRHAQQLHPLPQLVLQRPRVALLLRVDRIRGRKTGCKTGHLRCELADVQTPNVAGPRGAPVRGQVDAAAARGGGDAAPGHHRDAARAADQGGAPRIRVGWWHCIL